LLWWIWLRSGFFLSR